MSHSEERERALVTSLHRAGIGKAYHRRNLTEIGSDALTDWVSAPTTHLNAGAGWTFVGTDAAYDAAMLTARGLHIQGHGSLVLPLRRAVEWVESDYEIERMATVRGLFLTGFYETVERPLTGWQVKGIETLLLDRLDDQRSVFIQMEKPFDGECWWTPGLITRLKRANGSLSL